MDPPRERITARAVVLDERERVLLFYVLDPLDDNDPCWLTPGGGLEGNESSRQAAVRELFEETGLLVDQADLGEPVAVCRGRWVFRGTPVVQEDWYFAVRADNFEPNTSGWEALEVELHRGWRWWTIEELRLTDEVVFPGHLHRLVSDLVAGQCAPGPVELPWPVS